MKKEEIVSIIESNRIGSTEVADSLGKQGVLEGLLPIIPNSHLCGVVHYVHTYDGSNWPLHEQIKDLPEGIVLFIDTINCDGKAIFGDLVSKYLILYKKVKGIVVNGLVRDVPEIVRYSFPIWSTGVSPLGCVNKEVRLSQKNELFLTDRRLRFHGGVITCDASGCTLIESENDLQNVANNLHSIELQEDVWSYCINTLKWSTFETICEKRYLDNLEDLPKGMRHVGDVKFKK